MPTPDEYAAAVWTAPSRTLLSGTPAAPTTQAETIATAVWANGTRTLFGVQGSTTGGQPRTKPRVPVLQRGHPLARRIVALWPFAEVGSPVAQDASRQFPATLAGGASIGGQGLTLDGSSGYADAGDPASVDFGSGDFAILARIRADVISSGKRMMVVAKDSDSLGRQFTLEINGQQNAGTIGALRLGVFDTVGGNTPVDTPTGTLVQGRWHAVAGVRRGSVLEVWVDGVRRAIAAIFTTMAATSAPLRIGARSYSGFQDYFQGAIDHALIVPFAPTAADISAFAADPYALITLPAGKKYFLRAASGASFAAVAAGSLASPTAVASVVKAFPATASSGLSAPTAVATSGLVNVYVATASSSLSGPTAVASAVLTWTVVASSSLPAPTGVAAIGAGNVYPVTSSGSLSGPSATANVAPAWAATASGILSPPTDTATVGLVNRYPATSSGSLATPTGTASAVLAWTVVASGSLASPTAVATSGLVNRFPVLASSALATPTATATITTAAVGTYSVSSSGTISTPISAATAGLVNRYPVVASASLVGPTATASAAFRDAYPVTSSGSLPAPTALATASVLDSYAVLSSGLLGTPTAVTSVEWAEQAEFAVTSSGSLPSPGATANVIVVVSPSGISFPRGSSGNPPGLRGYQR